MKKIIAIAAVALFGAIVLPSCKKDYTCTCTVGGQTAVYPMNNVTKASAKASCDALNMAGANCSLD